MREYDDENIRLYTPVLQRVIILLAVIIAVPVVMWTITTMVRTYVAPPKVPTFQRLTTENPPPSDTASVAASAVPAPAPTAEQAQAGAPTAQLADAGATASDAHTPLLDIRKPAEQAQAVAPSPPAAAAPDCDGGTGSWSPKAGRAGSGATNKTDGGATNRGRFRPADGCTYSGVCRSDNADATDDECNAGLRQQSRKCGACSRPLQAILLGPIQTPTRLRP